MSVAQTPSEDDQHADKCAKPRRKLQSSTLPPVLFELPNLAAAGCSDSQAYHRNEDELAEDDPLDLGFAENTAPETPTFEPVPTAVPQGEPPVVDKPAERQSAPVAPRSETSTFDVWGTRAVVMTLLLLVISSAFIAARKWRSRSDQPVADISSEMSSDDLTALAGFAVSEGVDAETVTEQPNVADNEFNASLAESDFESVMGVESTAWNTPALENSDLASTATLDAPHSEFNVTSDQTSPPAAIEDIADATNDAAFGSVEGIAATPASSRTDTTDLNELLNPAASTAVTPVEASTTDTESQVDLPIDLTANIFAATQTQVAEPLATTTPNALTGGPEKVSGAIRYSSTPNGINDWDQYYDWMKSRLNTQTPKPQND